MGELALRDALRDSVPGVDTSGLVFKHEGRIMRALRGESAALAREILAAPWAEELFAAGLVRFWPADLRLEGYEFVVEAQAVPVVSYPNEWPTAMIKEAALTICRLGAALAKRGLGLKDAHPWNILYDGPKPVFVDIGSVERQGALSMEWVDEFRRHLAVPLSLHHHGRHGLADEVWREQREIGAKRFWDRQRLRPLFPPRYAALRRRRKDRERFFAELEAWLGGLDATGTPSVWSDYDKEPPSADALPAGDFKRRSVIDFLSRFAPGSALDLASNRGWFSAMAASKGHRVVAMDLDDRALGALFARARSEGLDILPLRANVIWPLGSHGIGLNHPDAYSRLQSDVVLAVALLHHLAGSQGVTFELFARILDRLACNAAIVEFIPKEDEHIRHWALARQDWYNEANFAAAMAPYFSKVEAVPSSPAPRRMMLFTR